MRRLKRRARYGFTLIEVTMSMIIFLMMIMMFAAVFPFAVRTAQFSNNYAQAALLAQHKIDELHAAGYARMDYNDLSNLGIIDSAPVVSPYSFTGVDGLVGNGTTQGFFPTGSTGVIKVVDYNAVNAAAPVGQMDYVTVSLTWTTSYGKPGSYSASVVM
jgi:prepilin-type N-terminal cleavage/methylation domain-containing protein